MAVMCDANGHVINYVSATAREDVEGRIWDESTACLSSYMHHTLAHWKLKCNKSSSYYVEFQIVPFGKVLNVAEILDAVYVDFSKSFDQIDHGPSVMTFIGRFSLLLDQIVACCGIL